MKDVFIVSFRTERWKTKAEFEEDIDLHFPISSSPAENVCDVGGWR